MDKNKAMSGYERIFEDGYKAGRASVVLPHPCDGELYKDWTPSDYFTKVAEEHLEVIDAYKAIKAGKRPIKGELEHFFKECTDLIVATTGLMHYLGCDEAMRQKYMKEINESNAKRDGGKRFAKKPELKIKMNDGGIIVSHDFDASDISIKRKREGRFKAGDRVKITIPESAFRRVRDERAPECFAKEFKMDRANNSVGHVIYYNAMLGTYVLNVRGEIAEIAGEWLKKVEE